MTVLRQCPLLGKTLIKFERHTYRRFAPLQRRVPPAFVHLRSYQREYYDKRRVGG